MDGTLGFTPNPPIKCWNPNLLGIEVFRVDPYSYSGIALSRSPLLIPVYYKFSAHTRYNESAILGYNDGIGVLEVEHLVCPPPSSEFTGLRHQA